ncbi:MAG: TAXI family TRAP transporter solute-binding subunit [Hyphomicrobiales bacterium]|nr:TAXI family TRAP transporter solute-binding subunit [Hyphomicrobiales bacterium]MCP5370980.1 TAXI family TRAP transporter solute-binding subunit [Hyphomicrobiales bacterium]
MTLGAPATPAAAADPDVITLSGAGPQGRWFKEVSLFGKVLTQHAGGLTVNGVIGKGVSVGNIKRTAAGKIDGGRFYLFDLKNAIEHQHQFEKGDYSNVRIWMKLGTHLFRVIANTKIKSFNDLKGHSVAIGVKGSGDDLLAKAVLGGYGVTEENTEFRYVGRKDGQAALANGQIDAIAYAYARNNQGHLGPVFAARKIGVDVDFVEPDPAKTEDFLAKNKIFFLDTLGEPVFGRPKLKGIAFYQGMVIRADLSDDLVYKMTKTVYENWDEVLAGAPWWKAPGEASLESAPAITLGTYHPGAVRYYKEKGVWSKYHP